MEIFWSWEDSPSNNPNLKSLDPSDEYARFPLAFDTAHQEKTPVVEGE
jgi:hypothetical protein